MPNPRALGFQRGGAAAGLAVAAALAAAPVPVRSAPPPRARRASGSAARPPRRARRRRCRRAARSPVGVGAAGKQLVAAFEKAYPNVKVNLVNAGTGNNRVHQAAERHQGRQGRPGRRADRVLRAAAVRAGQVAGRPDSYGLERARASSPPGPWDSVHRQRQARRPAAGLRPDGAVLQQDGLRQVRPDRADHLGRVPRPTRRSCTRPTRRSTSPTTPATPASPPA